MGWSATPRRPPATRPLAGPGPGRPGLGGRGAQRRLAGPGAAAPQPADRRRPRAAGAARIPVHAHDRGGAARPSFPGGLAGAHPGGRGRDGRPPAGGVRAVRQRGPPRQRPARAAWPCGPWSTAPTWCSRSRTTAATRPPCPIRPTTCPSRWPSGVGACFSSGPWSTPWTARWSMAGPSIRVTPAERSSPAERGQATSGRWTRRCGGAVQRLPRISGLPGGGTPVLFPQRRSR